MKQNILHYRFLIPLVMLYITFDLSSLVYSYKEIQLGIVIGMASSITFPMTYIINDIVTEVYGFKIAQKIVFYGLCCDFIFAFVTYVVSCIPSSDYEQFRIYHIVFSPLLRAIMAQTIGLFVGAYINICLMSKWKLLLKGKYFWLRSIVSSIIGESFPLIISVIIALAGVYSFKKMEFIILYAYMYKIMFAIFIAPIGSAMTHFLKSKEGIDINNYNMELNPFKMY